MKPTKVMAVLLVFSMLFTGCSATKSSSTQGAAKKNIAGLPEKIASKDEIKVMVIRKIGGDPHTEQYIAGAKQEGESLGFKVDAYSANGDTAKFHDAIAQAIDKKYDGILISHGDDAATIDDVKKAVEKGIPVVTFDSNADISKIGGVTMTSQDDEKLAKLALDQLAKEQGAEGGLLYLWVDGFPPMVRRNTVYQEFLKSSPQWQELDRFGTAQGDVSGATQNAVTAMLTKHEKGKIKAIFATWDAFASGAAKAVKEAGRNEIKIYGIDVSNQDLQLMQEEGSPWAATAAVDPKMIGAVNLRLIAKKIAGEETPPTYDLEPALITAEGLKASKEAVNMVSLANVIPGWGTSDAFLEPWMKSLKEAYSKK